MTKAELEQYRSIVREIDEVRARLNAAAVHDVVTGSDSEYPYVQRHMRIGGVERSDTNAGDMLRLRSLERQKDRIEAFIDGIPDSVTRRIFRMRYIDGDVRPSWQWIAFKIGVSGDGSTERKKVDRYLKVSRNSRK